MGRRGRIAFVIGLIAGASGLAAWWFWPDPLAEGRAAYVRRDYPAAALAARDVLREHPGNVEARRLLARASARMGRRDYAQGLFSQLRPDDLRAEDYVILGTGLVNQGQIAAAMNVLRKALEDDPQHPEALHAMAQLSAGTDRLAEAAELAERLEQQPGWEARGAAIAGLVADDANDPRRAVAALDRALEIDPDMSGVVASPVPVRLRLARNYLKLGQPDHAADQLRKVLAGGPDAEASWLAGRVALQRGDRAAYDKAAASAQGHPIDPTAAEPAAYVGASGCVECHADIARIQQGSRHAKTFRPARELTDLKLPGRAIVDPDNDAVSHRVERDGSRLVQTTTSTDGPAVRAWLVYAIGSGDRGMTPIGQDDRGQFRELRMTYYGDIADWDRTTGHPDATAMKEAHDYLGNPLGPDELRRCLGCHATDPHAARDGTGAVAADRGIGCERCHGPGGNHLTVVAWKLPDLAIGRPSRVTPAESTKLCAQCHSPKGRSPVAAGDPAEVRFQALTMPRSRCFTESRGAFGCVTCHNPHRDADTDPSYYEARCLACHGPGEVGGTTAGHVALPEGVRRVACPVDPASNCLECHMPQLKAAVPHTVFTDHHIRVHREKPAAGAE